MRNIKLTIEYDGTDFVGWQTQANGRSVQEEITKVLQQVVQEKVSLNGAGRTDSGVHARGQVANFFTSSSLEVYSILNALNGMLPDDVCVHAVEEVPEKFHARYSARGRVYRYYISLKPLAIGRQYKWFVKYSLDVDAMTNIAQMIIGEHDFESFCNYAADVEHCRCAVTGSCWMQQSGGLVYEVKANRFLHGMVRALVGTMVNIGRGYTPAAAFPEIMAAKDRT
ncbi:MAG: tRNA pseudouridine(38-40) synthase TruA, partial [Bacteroidota bacterium]